ncbi:flavin reductase (DIM6/NTAB) family NADH-FMN oxidoreductase RutF [Rhizobium sp. PP-F2F-G20b]|nr:flavin reductase (DIM6/NTAB) family NADH-FMN oxidoreductase RutF [Rhizobium sp. PP-CC-3A-592]PYE41980.1 flavin reductase (DIM6/NTAB) family NADH-FMN oxidoreductase RutF [Rhizobium sp. PP-F2F-G20b]
MTAAVFPSGVDVAGPDAAAFKLSMRHLAGAVCVITVGDGEGRTGFTATSVTSLSAEVPSVIVSLNRTSSSWPVLERSGHFCVNVLAEGQDGVAKAFAGADGRRGAERYAGAEWTRLDSGGWALADALTVIDCGLDEALHRHTHAILIGRVRSVQVRPDVAPLLYFNGGFRTLLPE